MSWLVPPKELAAKVPVHKCSISPRISQISWDLLTCPRKTMVARVTNVPSVLGYPGMFLLDSPQALAAKVPGHKCPISPRKSRDVLTYPPKTLVAKVPGHNCLFGCNTCSDTHVLHNAYISMFKGLHTWKRPDDACNVAFYCNFGVQARFSCEIVEDRW